jgi:hypothetical protein
LLFHWVKKKNKLKPTAAAPAGSVLAGGSVAMSGGSGSGSLQAFRGGQVPIFSDRIRD